MTLDEKIILLDPKKVDPLSEESKNKIRLIKQIMSKLSGNMTIEKQTKWFDELYNKSYEDLKIYFNVYK